MEPQNGDTVAKTAQPSPAQMRADAALESLPSPARSTDAGGDFARLLSLNLSPPSRMNASPKRRHSGVPQLTASNEQLGSPEGTPAGLTGGGTIRSSSGDVRVSLAVNPVDTWVTVELTAISGDEQTSAAPANIRLAAAGHSGPSRRAAAHSSQGRDGPDAATGSSAAGDGCESTPGQSAPEGTDSVRQPEDDVPPMDDWVASLPAVPKLPIGLATGKGGDKAASVAGAAEPSYADLTAQLAGSSGAFSDSQASDDDGSPSAASEEDEEEDRPRDPRRELAVDIAVADALAQVYPFWPPILVVNALVGAKSNTTFIDADHVALHDLS